MSLFEELKKDIRFAEGLNGCISCGTCTAICPAAEVTDYDPRVIVETIQRGNDAEIEELLKGEQSEVLSHIVKDKMDFFK